MIWSSVWREMPAIVFGILCIAFASLFCFSLLGIGVVGKVVFTFCMVFGWWSLWRSACRVRRTRLLCTNQRILFTQARGCFEKRSDQAPWKDVLDVAHRPDGLWRFFGLSQIRIRFHGARSPWVLRGVRHGQEACYLIRDIQAIPLAPSGTGSFQRQHLV